MTKGARWLLLSKIEVNNNSWTCTLIHLTSLSTFMSRLCFYCECERIMMNMNMNISVFGRNTRHILLPSPALDTVQTHLRVVQVERCFSRWLLSICPTRVLAKKMPVVQRGGWKGREGGLRAEAPPLSLPTPHPPQIDTVPNGTL